MSNSKSLIFIVGPTAVGKSDAALKLAGILNGEIISCDAMQVYREINIASNKPSEKDIQKIKHHLINIIPVEEEFHVYRFNLLVGETVRDIIARGKIPILVGGSGLYVQVLLDGLFEKAQKNEEIRNNLSETARDKGLDFLYEQLKEKDPQAAQSIHPHDEKRIIRALEVYALTGEPFSKVKHDRKGLAQEYSTLIFGLNCDREKLYSTINKRVIAMFGRGLVDEVKALQNKKLSITAERVISIPEVKRYLAGECDLKTAQEEIMQHTRNYAKRQLTWFRKEKRIQWFDTDWFENLQDIAAAMKDCYDKTR